MAMSDFLISAAVGAAGRMARHLGLGEVEAMPLHVSDHITLHLPAASAVVRIKPAAAEAAMRRELDVAAYLAAKGAPVVLPLSGPHVEQGFVMSFWRWVPHQAADPDNGLHRRSAIEALHRVHAAFADYSGELPSLQNKVDECRALLRDALMPALSDADRHFLLKVADRFQDVGTEAVPLHGDAGFHNFFVTGNGGLWSDFAAACRGPRGWDGIALEIDDDPDLTALRSFCVSVWCWNLANDPGKREAAAHHTGALRRRYG
jgi:hypothetical protein